MHRFTTTLIATAAAAATLAGASTASAATGHGCTINGGAAGCPAALNIPAGSDLIGTDVGLAVADDFAFAGAGNTVRCRDATIKGVLTSAGGPAYPIGGGGPKGYSPGASFTGPAGAPCSAVVGGGAATASVALIDGNGANPGLVDLLGEWVPGANTARLLLRAPQFRITETTAAGVISCIYRGSTFAGAVTNNALGRVTFSAQPVTKLVGPAACPAAATISVPFNLRWAFAGSAGPFRISA